MEKEKKKRLLVTLFGIIIIVLLLAGVSYAVYSADVIGTEENYVKTGCLKIDMQDSGNLNITNAIPQKDERGLENEPYTYTLTNTCTVDATYITTINVMDDTNLENLSKMKLSLNGDSYLEPTIQSNLQETEPIDESETSIVKTYILDEGSLAVGESKTFNLRSWVDYDVTEITGKVHNKIMVYSEALHNKTIAYSSKSAAYQVLKENAVLSENQYSYKEIDDQTGIIKINEDKNVKYYFRGNPNNYIKFGTNTNGENYTWRVVSSNDDGSINIALDNVYAQDTYSNLTTVLNNLYTDLEKDEKYIKTDSTFCEEKIVGLESYASKLRVENHSPTTTCQSENVLTKIGILSADDLMYAGAVTGNANTNFYLASTENYFTASHATETSVYSYQIANSLQEIEKTETLGIKPVITITKDAIIEGTGSEEEPFYVTGLYTEEKVIDESDKTAPTIVFARVDEEWSNQNKSIRISAKDDTQGSGIAGYIVKTTTETPSITDTDWESSSAITYNTINTYANGTYYVFVKDASDNISAYKEVVIEKVDTVAPICTIKITPNGEETTNKILSIESEDLYINKKSYSWDNITTKEDVIKINTNGVYTAYLEDLAGNKGTCSVTITNIKERELTAAEKVIGQEGTSGLEKLTHLADSTLQIGATSNITEYRFRGGNDVVTNNYVSFNGDEYRIIGVFPTDDGSGTIENRIKLLKSTTYTDTKYAWNDNLSNDWTGATLNTVINTDYWNSISSEYQAFVKDAKYYTGGYTEGTYTNEMYKYERKKDESDGGNYFDSYQTTTSWTGKIGLMYASDYGYAATDACSNAMKITEYNNALCTSNNWIHSSLNEWLITQYVFDTELVFSIYSSGAANYSFTYDVWVYRPVLYLSADAVFVDGDGSQGNPYKLIEEKKYAVNVVVNNGTISGEASKKVEYNNFATFTVTPATSGATGTVSCTNSQTATLSGTTLTTGAITSDTTCTVTYSSDDSSEVMTTLYENGTLIINELASDRTSNISSYGSVTMEYAPLSESESYVFEAGVNDPFWHGNRDMIKKVIIGSEISPVSTAWWCWDLYYLWYGDFRLLDTSNVVDMSGMFYEAVQETTDLTDLYLYGLENWSTSNVTDMSYMFTYFGDSLTEFDLTEKLIDWDTSNVQDMSGMFFSTALEAQSFTIDVTNWDVSNVTNMAEMFAQAGEQAEIWNIGLLTQWDTSNVADMTGMFFGIYGSDTGTTFNSIGGFVIPDGCIADSFAAYSRYFSGAIAIEGTLTSYDEMFLETATAGDAAVGLHPGSESSIIEELVALYGANGTMSQGNVFILV